MFTLYIIVSHLKLLNKSDSINDKNMLEIINSIINKYGGVSSEYSGYLSYFPAEYSYSRENFILCIQELKNLLDAWDDLVGYTIISDTHEPSSEFEYFETRKRLLLKTIDINSVWFTSESNKIISGIVTLEKRGELFRAPQQFFSLTFNNESFHESSRDPRVESVLDTRKNPLEIFTGNIDSDIYNNISSWARKEGFQYIFYVDFLASSDSILYFIDYLLSYRAVFDPLSDLDEGEKESWGKYLKLYHKFTIQSYDTFVIDDFDIHYNILINLWFYSFTSRYKTLLIVKYHNDSIEVLLSELSELSKLKILGFNNNYSKIEFKRALPDLNTSESYSEKLSILNSKSSDSLMVLYLAVVTGGIVPVLHLIEVIKVLGFNILKLREELENYKRTGFLIGDEHLYSGLDNIKEKIESIKTEEFKKWNNEFLGAFIELGYCNNYSYSYIFALLALDSDYRNEALNILYLYIERMLDLNRDPSLSTVFYERSLEDSRLSNILNYKDIRQERLNNKIVSVGKYENNNDYTTALEFIDLLNVWSENRDKKLINRSKELYFQYQNSGELFNEARIKILFSLGLLSSGSVGEAVDYFELNSGFSKNISDTLSYIRSECFLAASLYIKGDFTAVLNVCERFFRNDWIFFKVAWVLYLRFIKIRALIELGSYHEALSESEQGLQMAEDFSYDDILKVYKNWQGRILFYLGEVDEAREIITDNADSEEGFFFLSELEFYSNNLDKAIEYIDKAEMEDDDCTVFDENIRWRDGYLVLDDLYARSGRESILKQEITNFAYRLKILKGDMESLVKLYNVVKTINNDSAGIHDYQYIYYLYDSAVVIENNELFNRDNLLNKVTRLLQQRASNISQHNKKHIYLENFYNKPIIEISRTKKLF